MRKLMIAALIIGATFTLGLAQDNTQPQQQQDTEQMLKMGRAPKTTDGIGRAVVVIKDADGNPVKKAYVHLYSTRSDGFLCESWAWTNDDGVVLLPPLHMGELKIKIKADGFQKNTTEVNADSLGEPVNITLMSKK
ncbi:MAG: carboxypeptidase regulatory-like domain-containing protein [Acidobacteria bacterium]|nr:carboxypeptidase regulatory-like domain-containing protein [Acidobacteriota bacterium]